MIDQLRLVRFKGFQQFNVRFGDSALLVGPNNAGKSTIISALRLCAVAARTASRRNPAETFSDKGSWVWGYPISMASGSGFVDENVRHEFREEESRLELKYRSGATLNLVWPTDGQAPFFYVHDSNGPPKVSTRRARELLTPIGIVPTLTPVEYEENRRDAGYIREKIETRLSSRHFRNHLSARKADPDGDFPELRSFLLNNTEELASLDVHDSFRDSKVWIDVYYTDVESPVEKELYWAGDGLQIWLQLLFHIWRNRDAPILVLDEPDVFLHPDLQRRLVRVLEANPQQSVLASHAPEMASEAAQGTVTWIERSRRSARRVSDDQGFGNLTSVLGSGFNLAVARALRSRIALFVEGDDMQLIRTLAKRANLNLLAEEKSLAVVPIGGFSRWPGVEAFAWLKSEFLGSTVGVSLLLDRDYRSTTEIEAIERQLAAASVDAHIWRRKEIENYLLDSETIAKLSGASPSAIDRMLADSADDLREHVEGQLVAHALKEARPGVDAATTTTKVLAELRERWKSPAKRLGFIPGKQTIARLNERLQRAGHRTVTARKIAAKIDLDAIPEMRDVLIRIDESLR